MAWFRRDINEEGAADDNPAADSGTSPADKGEDEWYLSLKRRLHHEVIGAIDLELVERLDEEELAHEVRRKAIELAGKNSELLSAQERDKLVEEVMDEAFGYGPIEPLMRDHAISDILINGPRQLFVEKQGKLEASPVAFHDENHLMQIVKRIVAATGRRIDEKSPMVDARLPDGSRLNAIMKPLALNGPLISIRRFGTRPLEIEDLLKYGSIAEEMVEFLSACVRSRVNVVISGGTGSGKTTLLNCLSRYIPRTERVATIEDAAELQLQQPHVVKMETRPANSEGEGEVTIRDLLKNTLRMRPDRIIVGECRGAETLDMLQAMNTGHEGSLTTVHANTPRDAISRMEMMIGMGGFELPVWVIRKQIADSINVIVQVSRLLGGQRKVVKISELTGIEAETPMMHDLFEFVQTGIDEEDNAVGEFRATGMRPECIHKLNASGAELPLSLFQAKRLDTYTP